MESVILGSNSDFKEKYWHASFYESLASTVQAKMRRPSSKLENSKAKSLTILLTKSLTRISFIDS